MYAKSRGEVALLCRLATTEGVTDITSLGTTCLEHKSLELVIAEDRYEDSSNEYAWQITVFYNL